MLDYGHHKIIELKLLWYFLDLNKSGLFYTTNVTYWLISRGKSQLILNSKSLVGIAIYPSNSLLFLNKNYHTLSSLKQYKFAILKFWWSEVWHKSLWDKIKVLGELYSFLEVPCKGFFLAFGRNQLLVLVGLKSQGFQLANSCGPFCFLRATMFLGSWSSSSLKASNNTSCAFLVSDFSFFSFIFLCPSRNQLSTFTDSCN